MRLFKREGNTSLSPSKLIVGHPGESGGISPLVTLTIEGQLPRKSNSRRIALNKSSNQLMIIKSEQALQYARDFMKQVPGTARSLYSKPTILVAEIMYQSRRSDLSDELLCDLLERAEIISNDRQIEMKILERRIDPKHPRVLFALFPYPEGKESAIHWFLERSAHAD